MESAERIEHYIERTKFSEEFNHLKEGWGYIPVHEFGQWGVDAYWNYSDDMYFLQVLSVGKAKNRKVGLYTRINEWEPPTMNLVAVIPYEEVSRDVFEKAMSLFSKLIQSGSIRESKELAFVGEWNDS